MAKTHDLGLITCFINNTQMQGYAADGDAISFSRDEALSETTVTADGTHTYNRLNNNGHTVVISLSLSSPILPFMEGIKGLQYGVAGLPAPPVIIPVPFILTDPTSGTYISGGAVMVNEGPPSFGRIRGNVEYTFHISDPAKQTGVVSAVTPP